MGESNPPLLHGRRSHASTGYFPQVDGLRALAILAVIVQHYCPSYHWFKKLLPWGELGVHLFFVLSGFLIVGILLRGRRDLDSGRYALPHYARTFYLRRSLRIFPVFFLAIAVGVLCGIPGFTQNLGWHVMFSSNIRAAMPDVDMTGAGHFWSLAVEEQFYLVIPWVMLVAPRRLLLPSLLITIAIGPAFRALAADAGYLHLSTYHLTPGCLDSLSLRALLAYTRSHLGSPRMQRRLLSACTLIGVPLAVLSVTPLVELVPPPAFWSIAYLARAAAFTALVAFAAAATRTLPGRLLQIRPLVALGKVSYGVYVYHSIVPHALPKLAAWLDLPYPKPGWPLIALWCLASSLLVLASWYLVERPLLRLKDRITLRPAPKQPDTPTVPSKPLPARRAA